MTMSRILYILALSAVATSALADDNKQLRFGLQTSLNNYTIDDPVGKTAAATGVSLSGIALYDVGRESRLMFNINKDSYSVAESNVNVGQDVSSIGGGLSYQTMLRVSRSWKPWIGAGLGYTSTSYTHRKIYTSPAMLFSTTYADRNTSDAELLLNANSEWSLDRSWDIGLQLQFAKAFSNKSNSLRVGIYAVY